jgi:hypothetical protein
MVCTNRSAVRMLPCRKRARLPSLDAAAHAQDLQALNLEYRDALRTIEKLGKRYHWSPTVRGGDFLGLQRMFTWNKRTSDQVWENWAIFWLMSHVESSGLSASRILRFRKCRRCSAWFYAVTDHQLHCRASCRQKFHADSPEFRAKRARYMRERYRPQEKKRDVRAKRDARRKK